MILLEKPSHLGHKFMKYSLIEVFNMGKKLSFFWSYLKNEVKEGFNFQLTHL